ncbi:hypothetical protein ACIF83_35255 [Streptomyces sp. NPDC085866]|uniref:hypothetical protein n=1 Tax=Streptomyces sp. NPDC085866 TaxID=3365736 RepID=UPI0037CE22B1
MPEAEQEATLGWIRSLFAGRREAACGEFTLPVLTGVLRVRWLRGITPAPESDVRSRAGICRGECAEAVETVGADAAGPAMPSARSVAVVCQAVPAQGLDVQRGGCLDRHLAVRCLHVDVAALGVLAVDVTVGRAQFHRAVALFTAISPLLVCNRPRRHR